MQPATSTRHLIAYTECIAAYNADQASLDQQANNMHSCRADWNRKITSLNTGKLTLDENTKNHLVQSINDSISSMKTAAMKAKMLFASLENAISFMTPSGPFDTEQAEQRKGWLKDLIEKRTTIQIIILDMEERFPKAERVANQLKAILVPGPSLLDSAMKAVTSLTSYYWIKAPSSTPTTSSSFHNPQTPNAVSVQPTNPQAPLRQNNRSSEEMQSDSFSTKPGMEIEEDRRSETDSSDEEMLEFTETRKSGNRVVEKSMEFPQEEEETELPSQQEASPILPSNTQKTYANQLGTRYIPGDHKKRKKRTVPISKTDVSGS